jgi:hypothetical protein
MPTWLLPSRCSKLHTSNSPTQCDGWAVNATDVKKHHKHAVLGHPFQCLKLRL